MDRRRGCCLLRVSNDCIHHRPISRDVLVLAISSSPPPSSSPFSYPSCSVSLSLSLVLVLFESSKGIACANVLKILCKVTTRCGHVSREQTRGEAQPANLSQSRREKLASPKFFVRSCRKLTLVLNVIRRIQRVVPRIRKRRVSERRDPMQPLDSVPLYHLPKTCRCFKAGESFNEIPESRLIYVSRCLAHLPL